MEIKKSDETYLHTGLIGFGAAGKLICEAILMGRAGRCVLDSVLTGDRSEAEGMGESLDRQGVFVTDDAGVFFKRRHDIIIEAAGIRELTKYAMQALANDSDLIVMSTGALADEGFHRALRKKAEAVNRNVYLAPGALPGLDWLAAATLAETGRLSITVSKPSAAWTGVAEQERISLKLSSEPFVFFEGTAKEAGVAFPGLHNEVILLGLATLGTAGVAVKLIADPVGEYAKTVVEFDGSAGKMCVELSARNRGSGPEAERDAALCVVRLLRNMTAAVRFGG
ncbi:MAG: hypothetical protein CVV44_03680 [Spirochaetae bacterium HGW-Spirochaetae-1]|jgi:aspartate dehydrogenase|nr:MAG: hypothetical protein CVV44_03680 [Spirochaetae bacterium HGW-Spirochaetae-1]